MLVAEKPSNETQRLDTLRQLDILDTAAEERFDRITRLAKRLFDVPITVVSLVDDERQWFKSCFGLEATETPRELSFCAHAILSDGIFTVPDASQDLRFADNPLVTTDPNIRFYAGYPLTVANGSKLGTLCLIDTVPRQFDAEDARLLRDLGQMVERELATVQLATMDELTQVSNRRGFETLAQHALNVCNRLVKPACMLFFDLDGFKQINDSFSHAEGDRALASFAHILMDVFRDSDVVGRLGGDEFVVFLTNTTQQECATILQRLAQRIADFNVSEKRGYDIAYSVGSAEYDRERHSSVGDLMRAADIHMYQDKNAKR